MSGQSLTLQRRFLVIPACGQRLCVYVQIVAVRERSLFLRRRGPINECRVMASVGIRSLSRMTDRIV